jgi:hypothetical protein
MRLPSGAVTQPNFADAVHGLGFPGHVGALGAQLGEQRVQGGREPG